MGVRMLAFQRLHPGSGPAPRASLRRSPPAEEADALLDGLGMLLAVAPQFHAFALLDRHLARGGAAGRRQRGQDGDGGTTPAGLPG